jgi:hypothetical protein
MICCKLTGVKYQTFDKVKVSKKVHMFCIFTPPQSVFLVCHMAFGIPARGTGRIRIESWPSGARYIDAFYKSDITGICSSNEPYPLYFDLYKMSAVCFKVTLTPFNRSDCKQC